MVMLVGCMPTPPPVSHEENTSLQEYFIYDEKALYHDRFYPFTFETRAFTTEEKEKLSTLGNVYPYYYLYSNGMPYTENGNESFWDVYLNQELFYSDRQFHLDNGNTGISYDIVPYYNENTLGKDILYRYIGELQEDCIQVYGSDVLMKNMNLEYKEDFNDTIVIDYQIECPIYNPEKENSIEDKIIQVKVQIIGIVDADDGYSRAYMPYQTLLDIVKENNGDNIVPTDSYIFVTDNKVETKKVEELDINRKLIVEKRVW